MVPGRVKVLVNIEPDDTVTVVKVSGGIVWAIGPSAGPVPGVETVVDIRLLEAVAVPEELSGKLPEPELSKVLEMLTLELFELFVVDCP